jgi:hypothetical protein
MVFAASRAQSGASSLLGMPMQSRSATPAAEAASCTLGRDDPVVADAIVSSATSD